MIRCLLLGLLLVLSACSSGGGSSSKGSDGSGGSSGKRESASVTAASQHVAITVVENQSTTATVEFNYVGDGMVALIPPGMQQPDWLYADLVHETRNTARFLLTVVAPPPPGTYTTTIRFAAAWFDTEEIDWVDVDVTLTVAFPPRLVNVSSAVEFSAYAGGDLPSSITLRLNGNRLASSVNARVDYFGVDGWLSLEPQGNAFVVRPNSTAMLPTYVQAWITLIGADGLTQTIVVDYHLNDAFADNKQLAFSAAAGGDLPSPFILSLPDGVKAAAFTVSINDSYASDNWLTVEPVDSGFKIAITDTGFSPALFSSSVSFSIGGSVVGSIDVSYEVKTAFATSDLNLAFIARAGAELPQPVLLPVGAGADPAKITARLTYSTEGKDWLQFEPVSGGLLAKVAHLNLFPTFHYGQVEFLVDGKPIQITGISLDVKSPFPAHSPYLSFTSVAGGGVLPQPLTFPVVAGVDPSAFTIKINYETWSISDSWLQVDPLNDGFAFSVTTTDIEPYQHSAHVDFILGETTIATIAVEHHVRTPVFTVGTVPDIVIDNQTVEADLKTMLEITTDSPWISWELLGSSPLLKAVADQANNRVDISLDTAVLGYMANGKHEEWLEVLLYELYAMSPRVVRVPVSVELAFKEMQYATPRVVYLGEETKVVIRGNQIGDVTSLEAGDITLDNLRRIDESEIEVTIPAVLPVGEYRFEIPNALELERDVAHIIVKPHAEYPTGSAALPSAVGQVVYDPAREQFYFTGNFAVYTLAHDDVEWEWSQNPVTAPEGIALAHNGKKLLVGANGCNFWEIDLDTSDKKPNPWDEYCYGVEHFGLIAPLYTGLTIVANVDQWPSMRSYPSWDHVDFVYPNEYSPVAIASMYGTHIIWAGSNNSGPLTAYVFDARSQVFNTLGTVAGNNYSESLFSISANGNRISHYDDIYNAQLAHIGSLAGAGANSANRVGVSPKGSLAGMFDSDSSKLRIFDISGKAPFPELEYDFSLPNETTSVHKIMFSEDDRYMFVFATNPNTNVNRFYVFELE